jgi:hypothetical protein
LTSPLIYVLPALVMPLEVQAAGRNDAEHALQRREGDRGLRHPRQAGRFAAHQVGFIFRGQAVGIACNAFAQRFRMLGQVQDMRIAVVNRRFRRGCQRRTANQRGARGHEAFPQESAALFAQAPGRNLMGETGVHEVFRCAQDAAPLVEFGCHRSPRLA